MWTRIKGITPHAAVGQIPPRTTEQIISEQMRPFQPHRRDPVTALRMLRGVCYEHAHEPAAVRVPATCIGGWQKLPVALD